jgi:hypothetical protein
MTMTGAQRARALRERRRRGLRKLSVEIHEDDLREIVPHAELKILDPVWTTAVWPLATG